jgi:hypothetical protein
VITLRADSLGWVGPTNVTTSVDPGVPYGTYDVCAVVASKKRIVTNFVVDQLNGETVTVPNLDANPNGTCP